MAKKSDPALIARARELRDRYLECVNTTGPIAPGGKYALARSLPASDARSLPASGVEPAHRLEAA